MAAPLQKTKRVFTTISMVVEEWKEGQTEQVSAVHRINGYPWRLRLKRCPKSYADVKREQFCGCKLEVVCEMSKEAELWECTASIQSPFYKYPESQISFNSWNTNARGYLIPVVRKGVAVDALQKEQTECNAAVMDVSIAVDNDAEMWERCPSLEDFQLPDGVLVIGQGKKKRKVYVHKASLASLSPVFDRLFTFSEFNDKEMAEIPVEDVEYEDMSNFLKMVYRKNGASLTDKNVHRMLPLANRFEIKIVKDRIINYLLSLSSNFDIHQKLLISDQYNLPFLKEKLVARYTIYMLMELSEHTVWDKLSREIVKDVCRKIAYEPEYDSESSEHESDESSSVSN